MKKSNSAHCCTMFMILTLFQLQRFSSLTSQEISFNSEALQVDQREAIQKILRWGWKYNKNLEEQAAHLHMLLGWSQIIEVCISLSTHFASSISYFDEEGSKF